MGACARRSHLLRPGPRPVATVERRAGRWSYRNRTSSRCRLCRCRPSGRYPRRVPFKKATRLNRGRSSSLYPSPYRQHSTRRLPPGADRAQATNAAQEAKRYDSWGEEYGPRSRRAPDHRAAAERRWQATSGRGWARLNLRTPPSASDSGAPQCVVTRGKSGAGQHSSAGQRQPLRPILSASRSRPTICRSSRPPRQGSRGAADRPLGRPERSTLNLSTTRESTTGTILLKGRFPNDRLALARGFVNVRLQLYVDRTAWWFRPRRSRRPAGSFVFVIQPDSSAARKP